MFKEIKSTYFPKIIYTFICEKRKLNLLKYNKTLQNSLNISLINYKILSGKYIIKETKENWKIYNAYDETLLFEGNYISGYGREYIKNKLIYEGGYLNGKRNGKGKEYDIFGKNVIIEGEYLNGKRWNVMQYDEYGDIISEIKEGKGFFKTCYIPYQNSKYEGEYLNGQKNGKGKEYYHSGELKFEGEYLIGLRHGKGKEYYKNGNLKYEGEYFFGRKWDIKLYDNNGKLIHELKDGKGFIKENGDFNINEFGYLSGLRNGKGKIYSNKDNNSKLIFEGEYLNDKTMGMGKRYNLDGELIFEGEYLYNSQIKGKHYVNGKLEYEGDYLYERKYNGKGYDSNGNVIYELINGNGKVKEHNILGEFIFEGEYLNGKRNGKGKEYNCYGDLVFEGEYLNGKKNGKGKVYEGNILVFEGEYLDGERHGKGTAYDINGNFLFEGEYFKGNSI